MELFLRLSFRTAVCSINVDISGEPGTCMLGTNSTVINTHMIELTGTYKR